MNIIELEKKLGTIEGWLSPAEIQLLYKTAHGVKKNKGVILEIGSWQGKSTVCLATVVLDAKNDVLVYAVDPHEGSIEHQASSINHSLLKFKQNITRFGFDEKVHPIVKRSKDASQAWDKPIAFLWIDGDHSYEGVKTDFDSWFRFVAEGGIIAFHDCNSEEVGNFVTREVLSRKDVKGAWLADSIVAVVKSDHHKVQDTLRNQYIISVLKAQDVARKLPVSGSLRRGLKKISKGISNLITK